mmetsp:Transcript_36396/g.90575  ORF Transcript_36396/g.90575 Transcript_36396/m.90575 type:complete len:180 (-) Transcript_36396:172-711(-)
MRAQFLSDSAAKLLRGVDAQVEMIGQGGEAAGETSLLGRRIAQELRRGMGIEPLVVLLAQGAAKISMFAIKADVAVRQDESGDGERACVENRRRALCGRCRAVPHPSRAGGTTAPARAREARARVHFAREPRRGSPGSQEGAGVRDAEAGAAVASGQTLDHISARGRGLVRITARVQPP